VRSGCTHGGPKINGEIIWGERLINSHKRGSKNYGLSRKYSGGKMEGEVPKKGDITSGDKRGE